MRSWGEEGGHEGEGGPEGGHEGHGGGEGFKEGLGDRAHCGWKSAASRMRRAWSVSLMRCMHLKLKT